MAYEYINKWTRPKYYIGEEWYEYYSSGEGQTRDSDCLARANFAAMLAELGGEGETVQVVRESHFLCGWVEWIAIHESDTKALETANRIQERQHNGSCCIDEELLGRIEDEECSRIWEQGFTVTDRIEWLREHSYTAERLASVLAAVRGSWDSAAMILDCPSELCYA